MSKKNDEAWRALTIWEILKRDPYVLKLVGELDVMNKRELMKRYAHSLSETNKSITS